MESAYRAEGGLEKIPGYVEDTGEVSWLLGDIYRDDIDGEAALGALRNRRAVTGRLK